MLFLKFCLDLSCRDCSILIVKIWPKQIDDLESAKRAGDLFGYPLMIKSKRLAYDGRGNAVAKSEAELTSAVTGNLFIACQLILTTIFFL